MEHKREFSKKLLTVQEVGSAGEPVVVWRKQIAGEMFKRNASRITSCFIEANRTGPRNLDHGPNVVGPSPSRERLGTLDPTMPPATWGSYQGALKATGRGDSLRMMGLGQNEQVTATLLSSRFYSGIALRVKGDR